MQNKFKLFINTKHLKFKLFINSKHMKISFLFKKLTVHIFWIYTQFNVYRSMLFLWKLMDTAENGKDDQTKEKLLTPK